VKVIFARADRNGPDPVGLAQAASYSLVTAGKQQSPVAVSVASMNPRRPMGHRSVMLAFPAWVLSPRGASTLVVSFNGVANSGGSATLALK
jgi:hypothetical protein